MMGKKYEKEAEFLVETCDRIGGSLVTDERGTLTCVVSDRGIVITLFPSGDYVVSHVSDHVTSTVVSKARPDVFYARGSLRIVVDRPERFLTYSD